MANQKQIRRQITDRIVEALQRDILPWRRPWRQVSSPNAGRPANFVSKRLYTGINPILLELHNLRFGFQSRWWGTFRQWQDCGCCVRKRPDNVEPGQWGASIVFYSPVSKTVVGEDGQEEKQPFNLMRLFTVFNADQVGGAERFQIRENETAETLPNYEPAEELISATQADIRHQGDRAYYVRPMSFEDWPHHGSGDYIIVPPKHRFETLGAYYETLLHELGHWSEVRVGWDHWEHGYEMGELVAEISASYLSAELGVPQGETLENHAAYLKSWLAQMQDDSGFIFKASTQANRITDFLLSFIHEKVSA